MQYDKIRKIDNDVADYNEYILVQFETQIETRQPLGILKLIDSFQAMCKSARRLHYYLSC